MLGILGLLRGHPVNFMQLLTGKDTKLTADSLEALFTPQFAPEGSNKRNNELAIFMNWREFLDDVESKCLHLTLPRKKNEVQYKLTINFLQFIFHDNILIRFSCLEGVIKILFEDTGDEEIITLNILLRFCTGASNIPVEGFFDKPCISFNHVNTDRLPSANTCANALSLPVNDRLQDYITFKEDMTRSLADCHGFGNA